MSERKRAGKRIGEKILRAASPEEWNVQEELPESNLTQVTSCFYHICHRQCVE